MLKKLWAKLRRKDKHNPEPGQRPVRKFSGNLDKDEKMIRQVYDKCGDVKYRRFAVPALGGKQVLLVFVEGLTSEEIINRDILGKLMQSNNEPRDIGTMLAVGEIKSFKTVGEIEGLVLRGDVLIIVDGHKEVLTMDAKEWPGRAVEEPLQERTIRGPREGFTETGVVNLALLRRRIPSPSMKVENLLVGRRSGTRVSIVYLDDVSDSDMVDEVRERVHAIDIDGIMEPGALTELITERTFTPFPLLLSTERPDKVAAGILQGKVAIVSDGSPFAHIMPVTFADFYQTPEDYYMHPLYAFIARLLRFVSLFVATTATAAYSAVIAFHYEMIPRDIVVFLGESREVVPFSPFTEAVLLELSVELVREASIRLPGPIGPTIGIVGAIVIGQAAVEANLVSPVLLIIVAVGLMANFTLPNYEAALAVRTLRFPIIFAAAFL